MVKTFFNLVPRRLARKILAEIKDHSVDEFIYFKQGENNEKLVLTRPYTAFGMTAPVGFVFDGASSPWFARFVIPKFYKILKASCRHDWACRRAKSWRERLSADVVFFIMALEVERLPPWRAVLGLVGVRIGAYLGIGRNY